MQNTTKLFKVSNEYIYVNYNINDTLRLRQHSNCIESKCYYVFFTK